MAIDPKLIDELLANYKKPEDIIGKLGDDGTFPRGGPGGASVPPV